MPVVGFGSQVLAVLPAAGSTQADITLAGEVNGRRQAGEIRRLKQVRLALGQNVGMLSQRRLSAWRADAAAL